MPIYAYQCDAGHETDRFHRFMPRRVPPRTRCDTCGKPAKRSLRLEVHQAHAEAPEMVSSSCGCHPAQAKAMTQEYGHTGARWRSDGKCVFESRNAQLRYMKARGGGLHNEDEVRG